jgi:predicted DNA-binding transcriptional regulator YafY
MSIKIFKVPGIPPQEAGHSAGIPVNLVYFRKERGRYDIGHQEHLREVSLVRSEGEGKAVSNATQLVAEFEISLKTAQRDIEFMRDRLNCPFHDKTRKGYSYEYETFSLPSIYIRQRSHRALITRKMLQGISAEYIGGELSQLIEKITSILKKHVPEEASIDDAVSIQLIGYATPSEEIFKTVLEGCLKRKSLSFVYYSPVRDEKTTRKVDPYHLFNYMGTWHLIGYCHLRQELRDFNLSRITDAKMPDEIFSVKRGFSLRNILIQHSVSTRAAN